MRIIMQIYGHFWGKVKERVGQYLPFPHLVQAAWDSHVASKGSTDILDRPILILVDVFILMWCQVFLHWALLPVICIRSNDKFIKSKHQWLWNYFCTIYTENTPQAH